MLQQHVEMEYLHYMLKNSTISNMNSEPAQGISFYRVCAKNPFHRWLQSVKKHLKKIK